MAHNAEYALAIGGQFEVAESRGIPIRYGLPTPPAIVGPSPLSTAASRHRRSRPKAPPLGWALPDPNTRRRDDGFRSGPVQDDDPPAMGGRCRGVGSVGTDSGGGAGRGYRPGARGRAGGGGGGARGAGAPGRRGRRGGGARGGGPPGRARRPGGGDRHLAGQPL